GFVDFGLGQAAPGARLLARRLACDVRKGQYADQRALLVDHRKAADAGILHGALSRFQRVVRSNRHDLAGHGIADTQLAQRSTLKQRAHADVPVGHYADRAAVALRLADWDAAAVVAPHDL